ncbi:bifunctional ADP-dependent NAD(P)H-hydrate dehydratase/NAD(P)H-hydrate epimerase [Spirochaeta cellobiosiphila]|uniref:bifunctional ADP-dependent NAD(P)H-hydrate dehydratase/NAD(P)H-hydrate epimerase n=1 Tax=Spirochaeta cellobiosiphila TaxID=504483 RepID=UPI00040CE6DE|nr:bifunctional ADP-dependent NAD(P)H-hydrate dehydratase/NAD(P)H-hydrate epimerase [Spirochaeta cellobiosiphila]
MKALYTCQQMAQMDRDVQNEYHIPGIVLMENAGRSFCEILLSQPEIKSLVNNNILILAGAGNNGGDALVIARVLYDKGYSVSIYNPFIKGSESFLIQKEICVSMGLYFLSNFPEDEYDVIIDGLIGTGVNGPLRDNIKSIIAQIKNYKGIKVSIDVPSGCSDTNHEDFIPCDLTIAMGALKKLLYHPHIQPYRGRIIVADPGFPQVSFGKLSKNFFLIESQDKKNLIPNPFGHKGTHGLVEIWGGSPGMEGAALLAASGSGRIGAGLVCIHTSHPDHVSRRCTDLFVMINNEENSSPKAKALVLGCGWGRNAERLDVLNRLLSLSIPTVVDADGLFALKKVDISSYSNKNKLVLTPHVGEAAYLLDTTIEIIKSDPDSCVRTLADKYNCWVLLKDFTSRFTAPGESIYIHSEPNGYLGTGGSGDILAGLLGGLLCQGYSSFDAITQSLLIHNEAGRIVADDILKGVSLIIGS